eukprot:TRINITY_DN4943_c0_g1_i6.p1 TRINITY_DN4943_c0_g1~~TRINITY_DN4943_c0_g1_i6.p1  ORF type:complete len:1157 (-),score=190.61 TRINITY_DN4943_c0_g1_i6:407-3877(-)
MFSGLIIDEEKGIVRPITEEANSAVGSIAEGQTRVPTSNFNHGTIANTKVQDREKHAHSDPIEEPIRPLIHPPGAHPSSGEKSKGRRVWATTSIQKDPEFNPTPHESAFESDKPQKQAPAHLADIQSSLPSASPPSLHYAESRKASTQNGEINQKTVVSFSVPVPRPVNRSPSALGVTRISIGDIANTGIPPILPRIEKEIIDRANGVLRIETRVPMTADFEEVLFVRKDTWRQRNVQIKNGNLFIFKKGMEHKGFKKPIEQVSLLHMCKPNFDRTRPFMLSIPDIKVNFLIMFDSAEEMDSFYSIFMAFRLQQAVSIACKSAGVEFVDYISHKDLALYQWIIRPIVNAFIFQSKTLQHELEYLVKLFPFDPMRQDVWKSLVKLCSWQELYQIIVSMRAAIAWGSYYTSDSFNDFETYQRFLVKQDEKFIEMLKLCHDDCAKLIFPAEASGSFTESIYFEGYRRLYSKILNFENPRLSSVDGSKKSEIAINPLSEDAKAILKIYSNFYSIPHTFQLFVELEAYTFHFCAHRRHLQQIHDILDGLSSRMKTRKPTQGEFPLTKNEISTLEVLCNVLYNRIEEDLYAFIQRFPNNQPAKSISKLHAILLQIIQIQYKISPKTHTPEQLFKDTVTQLVKGCCDETCDKVVRTACQMPRGQGLDEIENPPMALDDNDQLKPILTPLQYQFLVEMLRGEMKNLSLYAEEFPENISIERIFSRKFFTIMKAEAQLTVNSYSDYLSQDAGIIIGVCNRCKLFAQEMSQHLDVSQQVALEEVFSMPIQNWIESVSNSTVSLVQQACETDNWAIISGENKYSSSLVDVFSFISQPLEALLEATSDITIFKSRTNGICFMEMYALKSCQVCKIYASILLGKLQVYVRQVPTIDAISIPFEAIAMLNNISTTRYKLDELLSLTTEKKLQFEAEVVSTMEREQMNRYSQGNMIEKDVSSVLNWMKHALGEITQSLVRTKIGPLLGSMVTKVLHHVDALAKEPGFFTSFFKGGKAQEDEIGRNASQERNAHELQKKKEALSVDLGDEMQKLASELATLVENLVPDVLLRLLRVLWDELIQICNEILLERVNFKEAFYPKQIEWIRALLEVFRDFLSDGGNGLPTKYAQKDIDALMSMKPPAEPAVEPPNNERNIRQPITRKFSLVFQGK